ncbi:MAG: phosphate acyltransferase PlsX [Malacoplasma sp.]
MKLAVDVMGFENDINEAISACRDFVKKFNEVTIILVGDETQINRNLISGDKFEIVHASDVIGMDDNPMSVRHRSDSSMYKAINLVAKDLADGVLSAGSTPCYVGLTFMLIGKIENVSKIGFMPYVPTRNNAGFNFLDVGAQKLCTGKDLLHFALMANIYVKNVRQIKNPTIGILNIGTEDNKGLDYHVEANKLLSEAKDINYIGFVESRNLLEGNTDIVISDGYSGNLVLKAIEGAAKTITSALKDELKKPSGWLGLIFSISPLLRLKKKFDYKNNAGALVIGLNKVAIKTHGNADYKQFFSSLKMLKESIEFNIINDIKEKFKNAK